jgi:hypothetical protein
VILIDTNLWLYATLQASPAARTAQPSPSKFSRAAPPEPAHIPVMPLGQTSRFSLELLIVFVLQLMGPMLGPCWRWPCCCPYGLSMPNSEGGRASVLLFLLASLVGGALASPRADLIGELRELLDGVLLKDLLRSTLRASVFQMILCAFSGLAPTLVSSNLLVEGLMLLLGLKLVWVMALDPLKLGVRKG